MFNSLKGGGRRKSGRPGSEWSPSAARSGVVDTISDSRFQGSASQRSAGRRAGPSPPAAPHSCSLRLNCASPVAKPRPGVLVANEFLFAARIGFRVASVQPAGQFRANELPSTSHYSNVLHTIVQYSAVRLHCLALFCLHHLPSIHASQ